MIAEAFKIYGTIIIEFLAELYVYYVLVMLKLERSKYFWLKFFGGLAILAGVAIGVAFFYLLYGQTVWGRIIVYIFLFALSTVHIKFCFNESYKTVLFCCSLAYTLQNISYKIFLILWCCGEGLHLYDSWGAMSDLYYRLFYYFVFIITVVGTYFLCIRKLMKKFSDRQINFRMLIISVMVLAITIVLCSFEDVYFSKLSTGYENHFEKFEYWVLRQTGNAFSVVCCALVLSLISRTIEGRDLQIEVDYLQHAIRQSEQQYKISKETIDMINVKCHDIKYKINALLTSEDKVSDEILKDLQESISIYDANAETGNKLLNVLVTEKCLYCEQHGIIFSCMADGEKLSFMADGDLYCLFGNIIDNAFEAVNAITEKGKRVINLVIKAKNNMLIIQEENFFAGNLQFEDGLPVTTKRDKMYHGFGMRSIRMIVHKYGGELTTYVKDDIFYLNIIFSLNNDNK